MSRLSLQLEEIRNALRVARQTADAAAADAVNQTNAAERRRLEALATRYTAVAQRLQRTLLDRTRDRKRVKTTTR